MKTLQNVLFLACLLCLKTSYSHAFSNPVSFDIQYAIQAPSTPGSNEIHVELEDISEIDETEDYTIYYVDYDATEAETQIYAYFPENVDASIVSIYKVSYDKVAIQIDKVATPPITIDGAILFVVKDDIIKPIDDTDHNTASINDLAKEDDSPNATSKEEQAKLHPNPANQILKLPQNNSIKSIYLINVLSNETIVKQVNRSTSISTQDLTDGVYLVRIVEENGQDQWLEQKLVIRH
jgi:hypothetical protein